MTTGQPIVVHGPKVCFWVILDVTTKYEPTDLSLHLMINLL